MAQCAATPPSFLQLTSRLVCSPLVDYPDHTELMSIGIVQSHRGTAWAAAIGISAVVLGVIAATFIGFQASDDASYLDGALGWTKHFPYVGSNHWTLRHTITLPAAASVSLLGLNEFAVAFPTIAYFICFLCVNGYFVTKFLGMRAALLITLLIATMPGFVVLATYL